MSLTVNNVDIGSVILKDAQFRDETLNVPVAATVLEGTILARLAADGNLVPFIPADGTAGTPVAILTYPVTTTVNDTDVAIRAGVSGSYRKERLVIHADGDDSNITPAILDQLRDYGLVPIDVDELAILDNQ